jgi:hypothetical protein
MTEKSPIRQTGTAVPMDPARLMAFFADAGLRVLEHEETYWIESGPRFLLAIPSHRPLQLVDEQVREILQRSGALGLRYVSTPADGGRQSFQITASGTDYSLDRLSANTRSKTRRGLKRNEIRRIRGAELIEHGQQAFVETMERQGRASEEAVSAWRRLMEAADREEAVEIWSAWHEGELASYLLAMFLDDVCEFYQARSRNDLLKHYPNNALIYTLTEEMLVRRGVRQVTFGLESLEDVADLDRFKFSLGFEATPVRQKVVFHPTLRTALAVPPLRWTLGYLADRPGSHVTLRKAAGLARFAGLLPEHA